MSPGPLGGWMVQAKGVLHPKGMDPCTLRGWTCAPPSPRDGSVPWHGCPLCCHMTKPGVRDPRAGEVMSTENVSCSQR